MRIIIYYSDSLKASLILKAPVGSGKMSKGPADRIGINREKITEGNGGNGIVYIMLPRNAEGKCRLSPSLLTRSKEAQPFSS